MTVAEALVDVAERREAAAIVVGGHGHGGAIGPTSRDVIRTALPGVGARPSPLSRYLPPS